MKARQSLRLAPGLPFAREVQTPKQMVQASAGAADKVRDTDVPLFRTEAQLEPS